MISEYWFLIFIRQMLLLAEANRLSINYEYNMIYEGYGTFMYGIKEVTYFICLSLRARLHWEWTHMYIL